MDFAILILKASQQYNPMIAITISNSVSAFRGAAASGAYEVTVYTAEDGPSYALDDGENPYAYLYLDINKTLTNRYVFYFVDSTSGGGSYPAIDGITAFIPIDAASPLSASVIAGLLKDAAVTAGFNASVSGANVTFTASETGNMPNASAQVGNLSITNGS